MPSSWEVERTMIYLDNAATSFPKPEPVYQALDRFAQDPACQPGRAGHRMAMGAERAMDDARQALNQFFHGEAARALDLHAQLHRRLNMAIKGALEPGDHVITTDLEHNSISRPLAGAAKRQA